MVRLLARHSADVNCTDGTGQTALHYAFSCGHGDCVRSLIELGADPCLRDSEGNLPSDLSK